MEKKKKEGEGLCVCHNVIKMVMMITMICFFFFFFFSLQSSMSRGEQHTIDDEGADLRL